jgi:predicted nicotinamide N-methyase
MEHSGFSCELVLLPIRIASEPFSVWTVKNPEMLLDTLAQKPSDHPDVLDERMPYWAELWPSARVLAEAIVTADTLPECDWLELGCGPGLPGLAASRKGRKGIWSDYIPEALRLAGLNAQTEGVKEPVTRLIDWRDPPADLNVSWILAADVAYEERNFQPLLQTFDTLLAQGGEVWLAEPGRPVAKVFFDMLAAESWRRRSLVKIGEVTVWCLRRP